MLATGRKVMQSDNISNIYRAISYNIRRCAKLIYPSESHFGKEMTTTGDRVNLVRIDPVDNPVDLFRTWRGEAIKFEAAMVDVSCLATVSPNSKVSSRNLVLRAFDNDGFVIMTDARSRKIKDMECNPYVAMCFLWFYKNDKQQHITRQVRVEGRIKKLEKADCQAIYDKELLCNKIRSYLCHQDQPADWDDLNRRYDEIAEAHKNGDDLPMPDHVVAYKLLPDIMEFYYSWDQLIADRMLYEKKEDQEDKKTAQWKYQRIAA